MAWIKRNLLFVIGSAVALVLMGLAGWFAYSKWNLNNQNLTKLDGDYAQLRQLNEKKPHPGKGDINNIDRAKEQREQLLDYIRKTRAFFVPIPHIPEGPKLTDRDFSSELSRTIDELQHDAANASVIVSSNYAFSFEAQKLMLSFAPGSLEPLAAQLGEVKAICEILFEAKVNSLDNIRRERVSADDSGVHAPATAYLSEKSITNELAVLTQYEVEFRSFSAELAAVLSGFAGSPHGFIVKTIDVKPGPAQPVESAAPALTYAQPVYSQPAYRPPSSDPDAAMRSRYGLGPSGSRGSGDRYGGGGQNLGGIQYRPVQPGQPAYVAPPPRAYAAASAAARGGLPTVLDEKPLKITINVVLVKPLPEKKPAGK